MLLESFLLPPAYKFFKPDHTAFAFARELYLFHFALAQCFDPMLQTEQDELILYAACTQQLIHYG
jgi:hypothetical protein